MNDQEKNSRPSPGTAIETCFMSIDELLVARILSKSRKPLYKRKAQYEGNMKKFFHVPGPRGKLGIFPSPMNMKEYEEV